MASNIRSSTLALALAIIPTAASQAQSVAPMRNSTLYRPPTVESERARVPMDSVRRHEGVQVAIIGGVLFGLAGAALVYGADQGESDLKIPIVLGSAAVGAGIGYLLGSLIPKVE